MRATEQGENGQKKTVASPHLILRSTATGADLRSVANRSRWQQTQVATNSRTRRLARRISTLEVPVDLMGLPRPHRPHAPRTTTPGAHTHHAPPLEVPVDLTVGFVVWSWVSSMFVFFSPCVPTFNIGSCFLFQVFLGVPFSVLREPSPASGRVPAVHHLHPCAA